MNNAKLIRMAESSLLTKSVVATLAIAALTVVAWKLS